MGQIHVPESFIAPGSVIAGRYRIEGILRRGGMGVVVGAVQLVLERPVAVKLCVTTGANAGRFMSEARHAARLESDHIVRVLDVGTLADGISYIAMERLAGTDLRRLLDNEGALPIQRAVDLILQACVGVAQAHAAGIVHRDLKPSNLFLARAADGRELVKVLDFGISKQLHSETGSTTDTDGVFGSPRYMSPEQLRSSGHVTGRTDVWSLGVTLFELLSGRAAFAGDSPARIVTSVLHEPTPSLRTLLTDVPEELDKAIRWCLQKDPVQRCPSVAALARMLSPLASASGRAYVERVEACMASSGDSTLETVPASWTESSSRNPSVKHRAVALGALALAVFAGILLAKGARSDASKADTHRSPPSVSSVASAPGSTIVDQATLTVRPTSSAAAPATASAPTTRAVVTAGATARKPMPTRLSAERKKFPTESERTAVTECPDPLCARK